MIRTILGAALLSSLCAGAHAQSNVTIYGIVDIGIAREDNGNAAGSVWRLDSGIQSGSRIGFRGTEDLGGGLSANFVLENGFSADNGNLGNGGRLFGRRATVGLAGGFGAVNLGRQFNPLYKVIDEYDPFGTGLAGDAARLFSTYGSRMDNSINYALPSMGGFSGEVAYGFGEVPGETSAARQLGLSAGYAAGPFGVAFAYHNQKNAAGTDDAKTTLVAGSYDLGMAKLHAMYAVNKGLGALDTRDALIGATVPLGAGKLLVDYIRKSDKAVGSADADQFAIGYIHPLSKRTNLYASYSHTSNDAGAAYNVAAAGRSDKLMNVGIRHRF
ncbi:MAG TPA: porin [Noviherbaspirillum sp.]|jgi:predicted porin|uniref:porin n=1 Tax=Noviherbaspirillum sp. TaxID=1926288 RepID=UPI002F9446D2